MNTSSLVQAFAIISFVPSSYIILLTSLISSALVHVVLLFVSHFAQGGDGETRGIIPRTSEDIFGYIENTSDAHSKFLVRASFLQVSVLSQLIQVVGKKIETYSWSADR